MAQQPFLKSIRPVNLLSFGPDTEEIELRPLNILIGPNGSGKSNLIEVVGLLGKLSDKDPWSKVRETGGVDEWIWKGNPKQTVTIGGLPSIQITFHTERPNDIRNYKIELVKHPATYSFHVHSESITPYPPTVPQTVIYLTRYFKSPDSASIYEGKSPNSTIENLDVRLPILAEIFGPSYYKALSDLPLKLSRFALYRDWVFGAGFIARQPVSAGQPVEMLLENASNLAQLLARYQSDFRPTFDLINELMKKFYEPIKGVEVRIVSTHLQIAILEDGGFSIPAYRLSDGTLRWLALLAILLNPTPGPVTCIEEPELGLHPDIIPTLADLLRDASTRTQLILTTHSRTLVECFSDDPESVCVCEKFNGATEIKRLEADRMKVWLEKYSLGQLWSSGEIGGNRW
jgi:predicted ATPase